MLDDTQATLYRSCVGSAIFLADDRNEIKFATKKLSQKMAKPTKGAWARLKRLGRFLKGRPHLARRVQLLDKNPKFLDCHCDTDWAGEEDDLEELRKSTDGGQISVGGAVVHAWSSTQPGLPSLSSAEAELRGMVRCAKEALYVQKLFAFMGIDLEIRIWSDSSAAIQAATRLGAGKMRHLETQYLWIQQLVKEKRLTIHKVKGEDNPADIYTKDVPRDILEKHLGAAGMCELPEELVGPGVDFVAHIVRNMPDDAEFEPIREQPQKRTKAKMTGQWWKPTLAKTAVFLGCICSTKAEGGVALACRSLLSPGGLEDHGHTWTLSSVLFFMLLAFAGIGMWTALAWLRNLVGLVCYRRHAKREKRSGARVTIHKVKSVNNPADALTKAVVDLPKGKTRRWVV